MICCFYQNLWRCLYLLWKCKPTWTHPMHILMLFCLDVCCKLVNVVSYTASHFSVWLVVAVTMERFIVIRFPLQVRPPLPLHPPLPLILLYLSRPLSPRRRSHHSRFIVIRFPLQVSNSIAKPPYWNWAVVSENQIFACKIFEKV